MKGDPGTRAGETPRHSGPGEGRHRGPHPSSAADPERSLDPAFTDEALDAALRVAPRGALVLAGAAVALLFLGWFLLYFLVFLARGPVS